MPQTMRSPALTNQSRQLVSTGKQHGKLTAQGLVGLLLAVANQPGPRLVRFATIPGTYTTGRPTLTFEGQSTATVQTWPYLASYTPAANDRVAVLMTEASGLVIGRVV